MNRRRFSVSRESTLKAQKLRREATPFERMVWSKLKNRQLGHGFRRQHAVGPYILDFYCPALKLCVELDGDSHGYDGAIAHDARRTEYLAGRGIRAIRFWNEAVREDVVAVADATLAECRAIEERA